MEPLGRLRLRGPLDVRLPGRRNGDKGWQVAVVIQEGMQLDTALSAPEGRPGKQGQAEAHHRGVHAVELVEAGRRLLASAKVERATGRAPKW